MTSGFMIIKGSVDDQWLGIVRGSVDEQWLGNSQRVCR